MGNGPIGKLQHASIYLLLVVHHLVQCFKKKVASPSPDNNRRVMASFIHKVTSNKSVLGRHMRRTQEGNKNKLAAKLMFALYSSSKQGSEGEIATLSPS